ncbi:hypothetical protein E6O75_ATG10647 [Venturia nashicola]|uniref:amidase n=1 Tax=Venturia nashicola TaxID=86259 RepID=A0A4Z1NX17_9PEZI|nr:hypothetical protein E6O75_ATG10647 [Venturia nashicola]
MPEAWQSISKRKKEQQASRIPKEWLLPAESIPPPGTLNVLDIPRTCGILDEQDLNITENYDATALVEELAAGRLKSVNVTRAFCKRAAISHQLTNCLTEIFFEQAVERALALDDYLDKVGSPMGPLHGLPISLKDTFKIPGHDASIGIVALAFKPATSSSTLVELLLKAGAVLYCKTNIPQTLMALDSHNNVFGRVINPLNAKVTAGGSSGGEGALVAMRGSILGVGTDVGGSIRIPAMCNNLYGIKPSWQRIPYGNQQGSVAPGSSALSFPASAGPIATSMRDCELFLRAVAESEPWDVDPDVAYGLWEEQGFSPSKTEITIGIVRRDGVIDPLPPINKIIDETAAMLRNQGITIVEMDITPLLSQCQSLANAMFGIDGNNFVFDTLESTGEPLSPWLQTRLRRKKVKSLEQVAELHAKKEELRRKFLSIWKDEHGIAIDAFICPVAPHPVPEIDRWNGVSYTSSFVLLDYPAGALPIRPLNTSDLTGSVPSTPPLSPWDKANRELWTSVDKNVYLGTPLCVQVVAPRLQEKRLVEAMKVVDEAIKAELALSASKARL